MRSCRQISGRHCTRTPWTAEELVHLDGDMIEERITIRRPTNEVFAFYADLGNLPLFLGDVLAVEPLGGDRWRWTIQAPLGFHVHWTVRVTDRETDRLIAYRVEDPLHAEWRVSFAPVEDGAATRIVETLTEPGGKLADAAMALVGKLPAAEVRANLERLRELLETGRVTDRHQAVTGKFEHPTG